MYAGRNGSKGDYYWWLASPSPYDSDRVWIVQCSNAGFLQQRLGNTIGVGPLVSLKSGIPVQVEE